METLPYYEEINSVYEEFLDRKVDYDGFTTYSKAFMRGKLNRNALITIIKSSDEFKKKMIKEPVKEDVIDRHMNIEWDMIHAYKNDRKSKEEFLVSRKYVNNKSKSNLTVLITNWKRETFVKKCFESVLHAGIENIVISNCSLTKEGLAFLKEVSDKYPSVKIVTTEEDHGCNQLWLQGLYYVTTKYVLILHDDDELSPTMKEYIDKIEDALKLKDLYFVFWNGYILENDTVTDEYHKNWNREEGFYKTEDFLVDYVNATYPLSPVVQIMRTDICIKTLTECKNNFIDEKYYSKPTMMLGNEIMMTLRTLENMGKEIYYIDAGLTLYGRHNQSESEIHLRNESDELKRGYENARKYFADNPYWGEVSKGSIIHAINIFHPKHESDLRRHLYAMNNWYYFYEKNEMTPRFIYDEEFTRMSDQVGDNRKMPFVKDIINLAFKHLNEEDIVIITNSDISIATNGIKSVRKMITKHECCFSFRRDHYGELEKVLWTIDDVNTLQWYVGSDLFAFTKRWWNRWGELFPDLLIGKPNWDWIMRCLMGYSIKGNEIWKQTINDIGNVACCEDIIYHEKHDSYAEKPEVYLTDKANMWNWVLAKEWFKVMTNDKLEELDGGEIFNNFNEEEIVKNYGEWFAYIKYMKKIWRFLK